MKKEAQSDQASPRWDISFEVPLRAVRLGMSRLKGMREGAAQRIADARSDGPFVSVEDLTRRAGLDAHDLRCLAGADALRSIAGRRPDAVWEALGVDTRPPEMLREARTHEDPIDFEEPSEGSEIADDYASQGMTLGRHPLSLLRPKLPKFKIRTAEDLRLNAKNGQRVRASGIVTHRQQPSTANGTIFATLEDETGTVNIIVWQSVAETQRAALRGSHLLSVRGTWQSEKGVNSLVAMKLVDHSELLGRLSVSS